MDIVIRVAKLLLKYKFRLTFAVLFMLMYAITTAAPANYTKPVVDYLIESLKAGETIETRRFILVGLGLMGLFMIKGLSFFIQHYIMGALVQKVIRDLREKLYNKIIQMPIAFFNKKASGELISRFTVDFVTLNESIITGLVGPLRDMPTIIFLFIIMFDRSWQLMLMTLALIPIVAKLISFFGQQSNKATSKRLNQFGELSTLLSETITGIRIVKAFIMEKYEGKRFKKANGRLYSHFLESIYIAAYSYPLLEITAAFFGLFVFGYGGHLISSQQITFGDFLSFMMSFMLLNTPLKQMNGISLKIQEGIAAGKRIFEILDSDWKIEEAENARPLPMIRKEIAVDIHQFGYDDEEVILKDIQFTMKAGTITALVGSSGSGKSTLANLIPRFYDIPYGKGSIKIDGMDLRDATLESLRNQIATVTQEIVLFNDTIRNNISYGKLECTEDEIKRAATAGHAHDFIMNLSNGYDQEIGEKGVRLSGGQRQRVSISRALIKNAPILILDEATSALDTESEKEVQAAIENLMKNRTSLVIAHRLSTIKHADVIHVLKDGRIIESGTHQELIDQDGEYKRLYDLQFKEPE